MIIVLMGYMGSGKSSVGKELATTLNFNFIDLDNYISDKEENSIPNIFKSRGEIYFRKKESEYLGSILKIEDDIVLALGGGTPYYGYNLELLLNHSCVKLIYLKASIPLLSERLLKEKEIRPLINHIRSKEEMIEYIGKHLFERSSFYSQAHYSVEINKKTIKQIVEEIVLYLF